MHVVLIEDDEKIGAFVSQGLRQEAHVVSWARSGDEGLALARQPGVDLAIVDVMLPGRDGLSGDRRPVLRKRPGRRRESRMTPFHRGRDVFSK
jgi:DNA-binding response OmpR family regulator